MAGKFRFDTAGLLTLNDSAVRSNELLARRAGQEQRIAKLEKALDDTLQVVSKVGASRRRRGLSPSGTQRASNHVVRPGIASFGNWASADFSC